MSLPEIKFKHWTCYLVFLQYGNGRTALRLKEQESHEPIATATINMPAHPLGENEVIIKDYGENEGMLSALENAGVVRPTGVQFRAGYVDCPVCELLINQ